MMFFLYLKITYIFPSYQYRPYIGRFNGQISCWHRLVEVVSRVACYLIGITLILGDISSARRSTTQCWWMLEQCHKCHNYIGLVNVGVRYIYGKMDRLRHWCRLVDSTLYIYICSRNPNTPVYILTCFHWTPLPNVFRPDNAFNRH